MSTQVPIDRHRLAEFCRRHHIRRLAFFGSVLRDDFGPDSDIDVLPRWSGNLSVSCATKVDKKVESR